MLDALGLEDRRLLHAFGLEDVGALVTLGLHLARHGFGDVGGRIDLLHLDACHLDAPGVGRLVEHVAQVGVDRVARGQRLVERLVADQVAQVGLRQRGGGIAEVLDLERGLHGIDDAVVDHGIHDHGDVVLGDDLLGLDVDHPLAHVDLDHVLDHGHQEGEPGIHGRAVAAESQHQPLFVLRDHARGARQGNQRDEQHHDEQQETELGDHRATSPVG